MRWPIRHASRPYSPVSWAYVAPCGKEGTLIAGPSEAEAREQAWKLITHGQPWNGYEKWEISVKKLTRKTDVVVQNAVPHKISLPELPQSSMRIVVHLNAALQILNFTERHLAAVLDRNKGESPYNPSQLMTLALESLAPEAPFRAMSHTHYPETNDEIFYIFVHNWPKRQLIPQTYKELKPLLKRVAVRDY